MEKNLFRALGDGGTWLRSLLLGVGRWGSNHLRVARSLPVELFVADPAADRLEMARKAGVKPSQLACDPLAFKSVVDAVVIATPAPSHFELCKAFLDAGKDVFVEKPITVESADALRLVELAERRGRILQVGHIFRFDSATQWMRDAIASGEFGHVRILRGCFSGFKRPRNDTGVMFADAIHFVDLFNFILDRSPVRVSADDPGLPGARDGRRSCDRDGVSAGCRARWRAGLVGRQHRRARRGRIPSAGQVSRGDRGGRSDERDLRLQRRSIQSPDLSQPSCHKRDGVFDAVEGEMHQLEFSPEEPLHIEWRAFLDSIETRQAPLADGLAGYQAVRVIEAALESARTRRPVDLIDRRE